MVSPGSQPMTDWALIRADLEAGVGLTDLPATDVTVEELAAAYIRSVTTRCAPRPRECNNSAKNVAAALQPLRDLYGAIPAAQMGPRHLRVYQLGLARQNLAVKTINGRVAWVRSMVRWAVSMELLPADRLFALQAVGPARPGHDGAVTRRPVASADPADVEATLPYLSPIVADAVQWLRLTGARPGEAAGLHAAMLEQEGDLWFACPRNHKTAWRGHETAISMGPRAWAIVVRHLRPGLAVFRTGRGTQYSSQTLTQAIRRGVQRGVADQAVRRAWAPNQLRHLAASECSSLASSTVAQRLLRHRHSRTTQGYIHCDPDLVTYLVRYG
jgi:integrase